MCVYVYFCVLRRGRGGRGICEGGVGGCVLGVICICLFKAGLSGGTYHTHPLCHITTLRVVLYASTLPTNESEAAQPRVGTHHD